MKYKIVSHYGPEGLEKQVSQLISEEGWYLQGGVTASGGEFFQALIKPSTMGDWERPEFKRETVYIKNGN